jgi:hypothetical protein
VTDVHLGDQTHQLSCHDRPHLDDLGIHPVRHLVLRLVLRLVRHLDDQQNRHHHLVDLRRHRHLDHLDHDLENHLVRRLDDRHLDHLDH